MQVFGGMGYIEETGAAQLMRDARICAIYEGTNGIQAIDLVDRKLPHDERRGGDARNRRHARAWRTSDEAAAKPSRRLRTASGFIAKADARDALASATPYLRLFALARGATLLEKGAKVAAKESDPNAARYAALARFFAENIAVAAPGLAKSVMEGAGSVDVAGLPD